MQLSMTRARRGSAPRSPRGRFVRLLAIGCVVALALSTATYGAGASLRVTGPGSNRLGTTFRYRITGFAGGRGDYVVAWEQYYRRAGCARTYAAESTRVFLTSTYDLALETTMPVTPGSSYSITAAFNAVNPGQHGICAYLINLDTGDTYGHAGAWWTNH
jgi:hypothetical protein